jgi:colicin import membrane protein
MSVDQLPRDATAAADLLASLETKDETLCRYPTCQNPRLPTTGTGRPPAYCSNEEHNALSSHRALRQLRAIIAGVAVESSTKREPSATTNGGIIPVESLRATVISRISQLQSDMERYLAILTQMADPDLTAAQIQAERDRAEVRIAEAMQTVSNERSQRLEAEARWLAAREEAQAEHEAAEQAIQRMEKMEVRMQQLLEETKQSIADVETEKREAIERVQVEARRQIEEIEKQSKETVALAQAQVAAVQEEVRLAESRAVEAQTQVAMAERLVKETYATLERERAEVDRLRQELTATIADARVRAETDRAEARIAIDRERTEVDRLRKDLEVVRKQAEQAISRADKLATLNDELQVKLREERQSGNQ